MSAAAQTIVVNEATLRDIQRSRELLFSGGALDSKRPRAWEQYGYPQTLTFEMLRAAYERGGAGHGAVHKLLDKCWQSMPRIKQPTADKETAWETKATAALTAINGWAKLRDFDRRNMVGRYAGLIYRVRDGLPVREPMGKATQLVDIIPVYEDQLRVTSWDSDLNSENFGKPTMWQYRMRRPDGVDTQGQPDRWEDIHPSRVQILAEGSVGDFFDGVPLLRAGFNSLVDLEKVSGGSGESFLKNSARTLVLEYAAGSSPQQLAANPGEPMPTGAAIKDAIQDKTDALNRNQDSSLILQGGEAKTLQTTVADPEPSFRVAANLFSASVQIPFTVLFGQQTGRLASDEDKADFNARATSRRVNELTPMLTEFVRRMQACGLIDGGEFEIEWPPLDAPGDTDKLGHADKMADINKKAFEAGGQGVFDGNEIRKAAGYEERTGLEDLPGEGDPEDDADPATQPGGQVQPALPALRQAA